MSPRMSSDMTETIIKKLLMINSLIFVSSCILEKWQFSDFIEDYSIQGEAKG